MGCQFCEETLADQWLPTLVWHRFSSRLMRQFAAHCKLNHTDELITKLDNCDMHLELNVSLCSAGPVELVPLQQGVQVPLF
jgi:hypothetical protein